MLTGGWRPRKRVDFCPAITQGAWVAVCEEGLVALPRPLALGRRGALALALGAGALLAVRLDVPAFFDNEARYAEVAREMALGGDWISPHLDFTLFLNKPPLVFWLAALVFRVAGPTEWARLVSVGAAVVALLATCRLGALLYGGPAGMVAGLARRRRAPAPRLRVGLRGEPARPLLPRPEAAARLGGRRARVLLGGRRGPRRAVGAARAAHARRGGARRHPAGHAGGAGHLPPLGVGGRPPPLLLVRTFTARALRGAGAAGGGAARGTCLAAGAGGRARPRCLGLPRRGRRARRRRRGRGPARRARAPGPHVLARPGVRVPRAPRAGRGGGGGRGRAGRVRGARPPARLPRGRAGGEHGAARGDRAACRGGGGAPLLVAAVCARAGRRGPARGGGRLRVPGGVPAGGRPRLLHRAAHHAPRAARLRAAHLSRRPRAGDVPRARGVRAPLARGRAPRLRERPAATARPAHRPGARTLPRPRPLR